MSGLTPTLDRILSGSLIALAVFLIRSVFAKASAPAPIPLLARPKAFGTPRINAAPSPATLNRLPNSAAALSAPINPSVFILLVGPPSKKSPRVSTSGVVAATSAAANAATSPARPSLAALAALAANPPGTANCVINLAASPRVVDVVGLY